MATQLMEPTTQFVDVRRYVRIVLANSWIVFLAVAVASAVTFLWSSQRPKVYESSSLVRVFDPSNDGVDVNGGQRVDPEREVDIQVLYATSSDVVSEFRAALGDDVGKVRAQKVRAVANADAISISIQSRDREFAQIAARVYTNTYVNQRREAISKRYTEQATSKRKQAAVLDTQIADLDRRIAASQSARVVTVGGRPVVLPESAETRNLNEQRTTASNQRTKLLGDADQLELAASSGQSEIEVIKPARLPGRPVSPLPDRDAAVAGLVGLFVGLGVTVFRYRLGDYITDSDELTTILPTDCVITSIPSYRSASGKPAPELAHLGGPPRVGESYRILRAELLFATTNQTPFSLLVSSARGSEGKTTVASNLAVSLAAAGIRVALVDADLRHGRVHSVFGLSNQTGLSHLRKKGFELAKAMQRQIVSGAPLDVLTSGPTPQNPAELLLNPSALNVIAELKKHYEFVVIDGPPVLPVADALHLARAADGVLLVGHAHKTQFASFRHALDRFRQSSAKIVGAVLVGADPERGDEKYYTYGVPTKETPQPVLPPRGGDRIHSQSRSQGKRKKGKPQPAAPRANGGRPSTPEPTFGPAEAAPAAETLSEFDSPEMTGPDVVSLGGMSPFEAEAPPPREQ